MYTIIDSIWFTIGIRNVVRNLSMRWYRPYSEILCRTTFRNGQLLFYRSAPIIHHSPFTIDHPSSIQYT